MQPKVSVLMPAYNCEDYVGVAVVSVLEQSFADLELLVVDDGSTDRTSEILASFSDPRLHIYRNKKNEGIAESRNHALDRARGEYMAWLDADDVAGRDRIKKQVDFLDSNPECGLCCSNMNVIDESGMVVAESVWQHTEIPLQWYLLWQNPIAQSSVMLRKSLIDSLALTYSSHHSPAEDYHFWCRLAVHTGFKRLDEPLLNYRKLSSSAYHRGMGRALSRSVEANDWYIRTYVKDVPPFHKYCTYFCSDFPADGWLWEPRELIGWIRSTARNSLTSTL